MIIFAIIIFLIGLSFGSFANCLIWRLYKEESIVGRSYCPQCGHQLSWYENIPLLSFLFLRGRCRACRRHISWQYPIIELISALLFLFFWWRQIDFVWSLDEHTITLMLDSFFWLEVTKLSLAAWTMLVVLVFDWRFLLVSTLFVWPMTLFFLLLNIFLGASVSLMLVGMAFSALFFLLQYLLTKGKGLGEGDIWLGLLLGAIFSSYLSLISAIFSAYIIGSLVGVLLILFKNKSWGSKLPLGVFLAIGTLIALIFEKNIAVLVAWYF